MKNIIIISYLLLISWNYSQTIPEEIFSNGIQYYNEGEYQKAISSFMTILENGQHSSSLYFNLGNSFYKINDVANSIFYFEKALQLSPNDKDIANNLSFSKNMLIDKIEILPTNQIKQFSNYILGIFDVNQWLYSGFIILYISAFFFLFYFFNSKTTLKKNYFIASIVSLCFATGFISLGITKNLNQKSNLFAIIFDQKIDFRTEPNYRSEVLFNLHEGTKVLIKEELNDWVFVEIQDGNKGWIETQSIKKID